METMVQQHFGQGIRQSVKLTGGYSFDTRLLVLQDGHKVVCRTALDTITAGGRPLNMEDIFRREQFFYETVNETLGSICPAVYAIGRLPGESGTYQLTEYIEGTPLDQCMAYFNAEQAHTIQYQIGQIAAKINRITLEHTHPYLVSRGLWTDFIASRLRERLSPLASNDLITIPEIERIATTVAQDRTDVSACFLHLDLRFVNLIYRNGALYVVDAENCEFGDPLFELAVISMSDGLSAWFLEGYHSISPAIQPDTGLFQHYRLERLAMVLNLFLNDIRTDTDMTRRYLSAFLAAKHTVLSQQG